MVGSNFLLLDSWREFSREKGDLEKIETPSIYRLPYRTLSRAVIIDIELGRERKDCEDMKEEEFLKKFKEKFKLRDSTKIMYTDASKSDESVSVGVAVVVWGEEIAYATSIDKRCSVYTGELLGIDKALEHALRSEWTDDILILSDSQAVIKELSNIRIDFKKTEIACMIREKIELHVSRAREMYDREASVVVGWVPGHISVQGNEDADGIAKEAAKEEKEERIKVPISDWRSVQKDIMWTKTRTRIEEEGQFKGSKYFMRFYQAERTKQWFNGLKLGRKLINMVNRLRTNHYNLNESLCRKNYISSARCECGAEREDINHVMSGCSLYDDDRDALYRELTKLKVKYPYEWLVAPNIRPLRALCDFLAKIGRTI